MPQAAQHIEVKGQVMRRHLRTVVFLALGIPLHSLALSPAIPDAGVVVYAHRNLEAVGSELRAAATGAGWQCVRSQPASSLGQNNLILECKSPVGRGLIIADDFVNPLDRASVQGYSDVNNFNAMLKILRDFVRRVHEIPNARILFQQIPERR